MITKEAANMIRTNKTGLLAKRPDRVMVFGRILVMVLLVLFSVGQAVAEHSGPIAHQVVDSSLVRYTPSTQVSGGLKVQGSNTMYPLMTRLAAEFRGRQPQVSIDVKGEGSAKSVSEFLQPPGVGRIVLKEERSNHVLLVASSREISNSEIKEFVSQHGYEPLSIPVAVDAVALYAHKDHPLTGLTLDQVDAMFSTTHNRGYKSNIKQWGQLGLADGWEKAPIQLYGRDRKSGTQGFFREHVLAGGEFASALQEQPGAASVILALSRDSLGIGYSGLGLQTSNVRVIPLAETEGMPYVNPSAATVANQTYPLHRILYLYLDKSPKVALPSAVQEFLTFITSREGQEAVVKAGFSPLPIDQVRENLVALGFPQRTKASLTQ
jgi:phosphate transport system substrate-binding protein